MDPLRCKTPAMVEKEIWAFWLGYNLVRQVSCQAAAGGGIHPREVSFAATNSTVRDYSRLCPGRRPGCGRFGLCPGRRPGCGRLGGNQPVA